MQADRGRGKNRDHRGPAPPDPGRETLPRFGFPDLGRFRGSRWRLRFRGENDVGEGVCGRHR
jgi:hypothetical protein